MMQLFSSRIRRASPLLLCAALWLCAGCVAPAATTTSPIETNANARRSPRVFEASQNAATASTRETTSPRATADARASAIVAEPKAQAKSVAARFEVVATLPHDAKAFTQGLLFESGVFYESTGLEGRSGVRRVDLQSGRVLAQTLLPRDVFGEGLALVGRELYQLSWRNGRCFVFDRTTLKKLREYSYQGEGWGFAYDGANLIMSDGSDTLTFRDPKTFKTIRTLRVTENGAPLLQINELEVVENEIWANVWHSDRIVRIDAKSGRVTSYLDCSALHPRASGGEDVLNGIAFDAKTGRIFVTGKLWPKIFALRLKK